ncbi:hypothetical protein BDN71DRAFT_1483780 [Pleurotus eryngii]|uniref:CxC2-like cysteine cluster KDZ transposase-associated domain-containing protein n=1 Tax=Pleurotus eryngii TaxID=5323 RepID=A0A9P5ZQQ4_PLEER|nr:hypothetical protein BDN71DRAFT_1483780 [Pleurotus eryngii]
MITQDMPFLTWMSERDLFVQEFLRLEAPDSDVCKECPECPASTESVARYQCHQCCDDHLFCQACIVTSHRTLPFHQVEQWNGCFFDRCSLQSLGLRMQLGHPQGNSCARPVPSFGNNFVVITSHGLVHTSIDFCGCTRSHTHDVQLLRACLFPATTTDPRTAATFEVLRLFQILTFGSKVSGYKFYQALARLTSNLEWRHIRLLKRSGHGHESSGVAGTQEGECAVLCPACPHPGKNLPTDWEAASPSKWVYLLFLAIDANFWLKQLSASNDARDPSLNAGSAYFVEEAKYKEFLCEKGNLNVAEASTCNNYDAVKLASIQGGKGTTASGVGTIECSRHDMKRPVSVGDMQKGERYVNMDYLYFSSVRNHSPANLVVSYDIACQWSRNLMCRSELYPPDLVTPCVNQLCVTYLVPKFHLYAHQTDCQINYSFNLTPGVGRTDSESPERGWAAMNPVASSTKEMGPGSQRDMLDDHFGNYNWQKVISLHASLLKRIQEAGAMRSEHVENFLTLSDSLPPATVRDFTSSIQHWEAGMIQDNPYESKTEAISAAKIRLQLAEEDAAEIQRDEALPRHDTISPSVLIAQGLELEDQKARLKVDMQSIGSHSTDIQRTCMTERHNHLKHQIIAWQGVQELYMPAITLYRLRADASGIELEEMELMLPSDAAATFRIDPTLADVTLIKNVQSRIDFSANKYRTNWRSLVALSMLLNKQDWKLKLQQLNDKDVCGLQEGEDASASEGRHTLSWIWMTQRTNNTEMTETMSEGKYYIFYCYIFYNTKREIAIRIEWCKARARAHRWQEECILLQEEMRRVKEFHRWQAGIWKVWAETAETDVTGVIGGPIGLNEGKAIAFCNSRPNQAIARSSSPTTRREATGLQRVTWSWEAIHTQ